MSREEYLFLKRELLDKGKGIISKIRKTGNHIVIYHSRESGTDIVKEIVDSGNLNGWKCYITDGYGYSDHVETPYGDIIFSDHRNGHEYAKYKIWNPYRK